MAAVYEDRAALDRWFRWGKINLAPTKARSDAWLWRLAKNARTRKRGSASLSRMLKIYAESEEVVPKWLLEQSLCHAGQIVRTLIESFGSEADS